MSAYLNSKPRYEILDGLRGVAAILVMWFHQLEATEPILTKYIGHGYLAVDFFFILSGFVIGYAYDDRWGKMSTWDFFKRRLVRLHPMIVVAIVLGMATFYFGMGSMYPLIEKTGFWSLMLMAVMMFFMIPVPVGMDIKGWSEITPLNGNAWSLWFEYVANILYALVVRYFPKWLLAIFVALCAFFTFDIAFNWDTFGLLAERHTQYSVHGGWSLDGEQMYLGFGRLLFPFFAGLLMSRMGAAIKLKGGFFWTSLFLAAVLVVPPITSGDTLSLGNGIYEVGVIIILFPLIVAMGAGSTVSGKSAKVCKFLGEISYPLYLVHQPIVFTIYGAWVTAHPQATAEQLIVMNVGITFMSIFLTYAILKMFDEPVREWLKEHWLKREG